ncbi:metallophosphoesterase [Thalassoglobus sp. JC818]|uniref:metallophosphoesterase n=1 Tax=Thalassoglobus sp. JC818 TaxID=3232136 RepID=UPI00345B0479
MPNPLNEIPEFENRMPAQFFRSLVVVIAMFFGTLSLPAEEILLISDIHFDPFSGLDRKAFEKLVELPEDEWPEYFRSLQQPPSQYGSDSNYSLFVSAIDAARGRVSDPPFILYPGDFLAHDWQAKYNALAPQPIAEDAEAYRKFTQKTLRLIANEFQEAFPKTPVFATLGNDDSFCQDYWIQPGGQFLTVFADIWQPLLLETVDKTTFRETFHRWGAYAVDLPSLKSERLIVLNTVLWSGSYCTDYHDPKEQNCCECAPRGNSPGLAQLKWLEAELETAKSRGQKVWLLMHVPPGLDSYVEEKDSGRSSTAELWKDPFSTGYRQLLRRFQGVVRIAFTGHTHMDDYRVIGDADHPVLLHKIAPAVSPVFGNNPAFQVYEFDRETTSLTNWETNILDLKTTERDRSGAGWKLEYEARRTFGITEVTAPTIDRLFVRMKADPAGTAAKAYQRFYSSSADEIPSKDLMIYICSVLNATFPEFSKCLTDSGLEAPQHVDEPAKVRRSAGGLAPPKN